MTTLERFREYLEYVPEQGLFLWKKAKSNRNKFGQIAGSKSKDGYLRIVFDRRQYQIHRIVWLFEKGSWPEQQIDHIDGDKTNNVIGNLRDVSPSINQQNKKKATKSNKSSGLLGVTWNESCKKWQSVICLDGQLKYIGVFKTADEAHQAYLSVKRRLHEGCTI